MKMKKKEETNLQRKLSEIKTKKSASLNEANPYEINSLIPNFFSNNNQAYKT